MIFSAPSLPRGSLSAEPLKVLELSTATLSVEAILVLPGVVTRAWRCCRLGDARHSVLILQRYLCTLQPGQPVLRVGIEARESEERISHY